MHLHPDDEPGFAGRLWDANPDVCCAAYQLGACSHTESGMEDYMDDDTYTLDADECLEYGDDCSGPVEYRWPGVGDKHWPRCVYHGDRRVDNVSDLERAAQSPLRPDWFDEADAGERWDDDY